MSGAPPNAPKKPRPPHRNFNYSVSPDTELNLSGVGNITVTSPVHGTSRTFQIDYNQLNVLELRIETANQTGLSKNDFNLYKIGEDTPMNDDRILNTYGLGPGSEVYLFIKVKSGKGGKRTRKMRRRSHKRKSRKQ